jgi:ABC-type antimicrobial peptide transport system permease subunit
MGEVGQIYLPFPQSPSASVSLAVRAKADPSTLTSEIRRSLAGLDRDVPVYRVRTLEEARAEAHASIRLGTLLLILFGSIALLLASVGIYGVISYSVGVRIREFGIRAAMGAGAWELIKLSLGKAVRLIGAGTVLGLLGAFALTRLMSTILTGISANDPLTFATATVILLLVGLAASYVPVRRASRVDPTVTLRAE